MGSSPTSRTMKRKYRIKEYIRANGTSFFNIQERFLFIFWCSNDNWLNNFQTKKEAERVIEDLEGRKIVDTKIHR